MSELREGQIVVVWLTDSANRHIRIFVSEARNEIFGRSVYMCRDAGQDAKYATPWFHCLPLEDVEPGAFIAKESKVFLNAASYAGFSHREANEKDRQIQWLCKRLVGEMVMAKCPPGMGNNCCKDCEFCWELASRKAAMDVLEEEDDA